MNHRIHVAQKFGERLARDIRVVKLRAPHGALPIQLLQQICFQVIATGGVDDVKQAQQRAAMVDTVLARGEHTGAPKQLLQPQPRARALGQGAFKGERIRCAQCASATCIFASVAFAANTRCSWVTCGSSIDSAPELSMTN